MNPRQKLITYPLIGLAIGVGLALISIILAGAGHGFILPAMVFFPYTMFGANLFPLLYEIFLILALLQYPFYSFLIARVVTKKSEFRTLQLMLVLHILFVILSFLTINAEG